MRNDRLVEIGILRSFVMLFVIGIHVLNLPQLYLLTGSLGHGFYFLWRASLIFAVPCFMFLSMMMISYTHEGKPFSAARFYKGRALRIVLPYLLWSALYLLLGVTINAYSMEDLCNASNWIYWLSYGKAYDHLYFMAIMIQFYILAPMMYALARRVKDSPWMSLGIAFLPQLAIYWLNRLYIYEHYKMLTSSAAWYWYIAFLGLYFGFDYPQKRAWIARHIRAILACNLITFAIHLYYQRLLWHQLWEDISFDTFLYTGNLYIYIATSIFTWLWLSIKLEQNHQSGKRKLLFDSLSVLSRYSYGIYLMHPIFMAVLRKLEQTGNPYLWFPLTIMNVALLAVLCGILTKYGEKLPIIRYAFGKS